MNGKENKADVFLRAFDSLSKIEKSVVAARLLDDLQLREAVLDLGHIRECDSECVPTIEQEPAERIANED